MLSCRTRGPARGISFIEKSSPIRLIGRPPRKIQRQPTTSVTTPPSSGPSTCPTAATVALMPRPLERMWPGKTSVSSAVVLVMIAAAPTPCTRRIAMRKPGSAARPQPRVASMKITMPAR